MPTAPVSATTADPFAGYTAKYNGGGALGGIGGAYYGAGDGFQLYDPSGALVNRAAVSKGLGLSGGFVDGNGNFVSNLTNNNSALTEFYKSKADADSLSTYQAQSKIAREAASKKSEGRFGKFALSAAALATPFAIAAAAPLAAGALAAGTAGAGTAAGAGAAAGGFSLGSTALGAGIGGGLGYLQGGAKGALTGAITGGIGGYSAGGGASQFGNYLNNATGLGLSGAQAAGLGGTLLGAGGGYITGGKTGALTGGAISGLGSYYKAGGFDGLGDSLFGSGDASTGKALTGSITTPVSSGAYVSPTASSAYENSDDLLGNFSKDNSLSDSLFSGLTPEANPSLPAINYSSDSLSPVGSANWSSVFGGPSIATSAAPAAGRKLFGAAGQALDSTDNVSEVEDLLPTKTSYGALVSPLLSAGIGTYTNQAAASDLIDAQKKNQALLSPFLNASFSPGDLENEPGYQFQLKQGTDALNRAQAARGNFFSGGALQAAQDYGQGLASTTYKDAFNRYLQSQQQKIGVAGALADSNSSIGAAKAGALIGSGNAISQGIAGASNVLYPSTNDQLITQYLRRLSGGQ